MARLAAALFALAFAAPIYAQSCPPIDPAAQAQAEKACRAGGGEWSRFGVRDYLCNVYSCAERTKDGGKACRDRADCEHLCVARKEAPIGTELAGECTAVKTTFGCATHVDGGRVVGRVCVE